MFGKYPSKYIKCMQKNSNNQLQRFPMANFKGKTSEVFKRTGDF